MISNTLYHYLSADNALDDIRNRWLKVSRLNELNDPFEFSGLKVRNDNEKETLEQIKRDMSGAGVICFSKNWEKMTMWSHYAEKHTGICLGFNVLKQLDDLRKVEYCAERYDVPKEPPQTTNEKLEVFELFKKKLFFTKSSDWEYEDECRVWRELAECTKKKSCFGKNDLYFYDFVKNPFLELTQVIIGLHSKVTPGKINNALGDIKDKVTIYEVSKSNLEYKLIKNIAP